LVDTSLLSQDGRSNTYKASDRLYSLDLVRGICSISVAAYHFQMWSEVDVPNFALGILSFCGTYGVSLFFVLSGYSLAHAYSEKFRDHIHFENYARYIKRRIGRLFPLFSMTLLISLIAKAFVGKTEIIYTDLIVNLTMTFGFLDPAATPVIGGWSIGIEVVFYTFLPILLIFRSYKYIAIYICISIILTLSLSLKIADAQSLAAEWPMYVQPANHFIFFASGIALRMLGLRNYPLPMLAHGVILASIVLLAGWIALGATELQLVTGWRRLALVVLSIAIVAYAANYRVPAHMMRSSDALGGLSYSLYLAHPLAFFAFATVFEPEASSIAALFITVILLSLAADRLVDRPIQVFVKSRGW
jgi:exopolysaccharide production protein ExoZ